MKGLGLVDEFESSGLSGQKRGFSPDSGSGRSAKGSAPLGSGCPGLRSSGASDTLVVETGWSHSCRFSGMFSSSHWAVTSLRPLSEAGIHLPTRSSRFCWNHEEMAALVSESM